LVGERKLGTKTEVKNINSFRAVEKALLSEEVRHREVLEEGRKIVQETRFFNEKTESTSGMRSKEDAHDYRYFPEPDLPSLEPENSWIEEIRQTLGELPTARRERLISQFKLTKEAAALLVSDRTLAHLFEGAAAILPDQGQVLANWLTGEITAYLNEHGKTISGVNLTAERLAELVRLISAGQINNKIGKQLLPDILTSQKTVSEIVAAAGLTQISDQGELLKIAQEIVQNNPKQVEQYKSGKEAVMMFLVGQMMKATKGRANPQLAGELIKQVLSS
jgi:aspartyl-tRNA(Asn)/glutamyl-tRNA(Gln) amidotransferase subunit B